jgi:hypothetical protein
MRISKASATQQIAVYPSPIKIRVNGKMQGLRSIRNRSLQRVNEDFEGERNAADCRLDEF